jgi:hypothetical protein
VLIVKVYPDTIYHYLSQVYTGLQELAASGEITLKFFNRHYHQGRRDSRHTPFTLIVKVIDTDSQRHRTLCFDMMDGAFTYSMDDLDRVDVYIKRTFDADFAESLQPRLKDKIIPFGLHYCCRSPHETSMMLLHLLFNYNHINKRFRQRPFKALKQTLGRPLKLMLFGKILHQPVPRSPLLIQDFEVEPDTPVERKIYFRTRVYNIGKANSEWSLKEMKKVNAMRVAVIRAMQSHFGERFIGGLKPTEYAVKTYSDCVSTLKLDMEMHIKKSQQYLININTEGLHGSVGWKMPEYLAASRCIVSEPINIQLPDPLIDGKHYLSFSSPLECIEACEKLLGDEKLADAMRRDAFAYYKEYVIPSKLVMRCIRNALLR